MIKLEYMKFLAPKFIFHPSIGLLLMSLIFTFIVVAAVISVFNANFASADQDPVITNVSPAEGTLGSSFVITVTGSQFKSSQGGGASSTAVLIHYSLGSIPLPTIVNSGTSLTATVNGSLELYADGGYFISVFNNTPQPGVYSNNFPFTLYNAPPYVPAASLSYDYYCSVSPVGMIDLSWEYEDPAADSNNETQYRFQADSNSNFTNCPSGEGFNPADYPNCIVNKIALNLNNPPGTVNHELVEVTVGEGSGYLQYGQTYYWRVKIWQGSVLWENPDPGVEKPLNSGWVYGGAFGTPEGPAPYADFSFSITSPSVIFENNSACYDGSGSPISCASYAWDFGDGTGIYDFSEDKFKYSYESPGTYLVRLTVSDDELQCAAEKSVDSPNEIIRSGIQWKETDPYSFASVTPSPTPTPTPTPSPPP